jgi:pimeloyl-ACP methyl ester carboxylesterase
VPELLDHVIIYGQVIQNLTFNDEVYDALERSAMSAAKKKRLARIRGEKEHSVEDMKHVMGWIRKYTEGYYSKTGGKMPIGALLLGLLGSPDYSLKDIVATMANGYAKNDSLMGELMRIDLTDAIGSVKIPYLMMQGGTDIVTSTKTATELAASCANENLHLKVFENIGHMPGQKAMDRIVEEVATFLGC